MQAIDRQVNTPTYVPDYIASSLLDVDFKLLKKRGIRFIAFDADSTLVNFRGKALSKETKTFLQKQRALFDGWCIASNRITDDLLPLGESMGAQVIRATWLTRKPSRRFFARVVSIFGGQPNQIAMIGDKLVADIYGAKKSELVTVWVEKIGRDNIWDRLIGTRRIERWMTKRYIS